MVSKSSFSDDRSLLTSEEDNTADNGFGTRNYGATSDEHLARDRVGQIEQQTEGVKRSVTKTGVPNVNHKNVHFSERAFWVDIFTTFLDAQWRWLLLAIFLGYFSSWLIFGTIWFIILYAHGDFLPENIGNPNWRPCVTNMEDFTSTFLFSLETQQTTGYGYYHLTEKCASAVLTLSIQSIIGVILEGLVVGLVLLKMSRGKKRTATLLFTRNAVISKRDGHLCLTFRVADLRSKSTLLQATIRAQLISTRLTLEGEEVPINQEELVVGGEGERSNHLLLLWPTTVIHRIDESSPLSKFITDDNWSTSTPPPFEIIVILEGVVESTGLLTQARTSYLSSEILWGHRFKSLARVLSTSKAGLVAGSTFIDYANFHDTVAVGMPKGRAPGWSY